MDTIARSTVPEGSTEQWRDPKRYLWLIGLVVPSLFFIGYGGWLLTGVGLFFWIGPVVILVIVPAIDLVAGLDRSNPPDDVIEALEQDRYYRWITYLFLPIQYVGFVGAMYLIARGDPLGIGGDLNLFEKVGPGRLDRCDRRHRHQHRPRARPQEGEPRALAVQDRAGAELLRPLLHRAQPRPPRAGRDAGGPGQQPGRRELLPVLAAHRGRVAEERLAHREAPLRPQEAAPVPDRQRRPQRLADVRWSCGVRWSRGSASGCCPTWSSRPSSASRCSRSSTTWSTTGCCARRSASATGSATSGSTPRTPGTPTTSRPTCCSTTCSGTATTTPTRPGATRRCATTSSRRCCRPGTPG